VKRAHGVNDMALSMHSSVSRTCAPRRAGAAPRPAAAAACVSRRAAAVAAPSSSAPSASGPQFGVPSGRAHRRSSLAAAAAPEAATAAASSSQKVRVRPPRHSRRGAAPARARMSMACLRHAADGRVQLGTSFLAAAAPPRPATPGDAWHRSTPPACRAAAPATRTPGAAGR